MTVSLTSILSSYGQGTAKTGASAEVTAAIQKLAQQTAAKKTDTSSGMQVSISAEALAAATAKEDNAKDFSALAAEVRTALDGQYAGGTRKDAADLSELSGRALSAIALNEGGQFSSAERLAAKKLLQEQTRDSFASSVGIGGSLSAMADFSKLLAAQYDDMSPEERQARGWTEQFRDTNASFAADAAADAAMPSLFDQI